MFREIKRFYFLGIVSIILANRSSCKNGSTASNIISTMSKRTEGAGRNRGRKEVVYPIFLECANNVTDDFWITVFEDMAYGKCPRGLFIKNNTINSMNKKKEKSFVYNFSDKTAEEINSELYRLILETTNICSDKDAKKKKKDMLTIKKEIQELKNVDRFSEIRKKKQREMYFDLFVIKMKHKHNLTQDQAQSLSVKIKLGFIQKYFASADVDYKDGEIRGIRGLKYDKEKKEFVILNESKLKDETMVEDDVFLYRFWNKNTRKVKRA